MCLTNDEKEDLFRRLGNSEVKHATVETKILVSSAAIGIFLAMGGWFISNRLSAFDQSVTTLSTITTTMSVLSEQVRAHVSDDSRHASNYQLNAMGSDVSALEMQVQDMRVEIETMKVRGGQR